MQLARNEFWEEGVTEKNEGNGLSIVCVDLLKKGFICSLKADSAISDRTKISLIYAKFRFKPDTAESTLRLGKSLSLKEQNKYFRFVLSFNKTS